MSGLDFDFSTHRNAVAIRCCTSLESVYFPESVAELSADVFEGCSCSVTYKGKAFQKM